MMRVGLTDDAGRAAYLAGLDAARAFIFETTRRVFKTHSAVQREFSRLVKDDPRVDTGLRAFLSRTYQLKAIADYLTGPVRTYPQRPRAKRSRQRGGLSDASRVSYCRTGSRGRAHRNQTAPDESPRPHRGGDDPPRRRVHKARILTALRVTEFLRFFSCVSLVQKSLSRQRLREQSGAGNRVL